MQRDRRWPRTAALRRRLLAGAGAVALVASGGAAFAQQAPAAAPQTAEQPGPDGLTPGAVYIEADSTSRDGNVITARGGEERVLARFRNTTLRAGEVSYDLNLGVASARDRVEFTDPGGNQVFASQMQIDSDMRAGVAVDFATRFRNGASLMAATAVRRSQNVNELNYAIFTPCPICDAEGNTKQPSISIQAENVVQDEGLRAILYRNAVFRVGGVPVFYLPVFSHPDPTVERASGLLVPIPAYDQGRGFSVEVPYLHVVSPSEDWLISPQINTEVAPFLNLQWRRRFADGMIVLRGGYTYERNFGDFDIDGDGFINSDVLFGDRTSRSYFIGHGAFDPAGPWRWGFTAERTSDKTLFDRYDVRSPYQDNGLYYGDERRLISQIYAERQTERSYLSVAAFSIQSLRVKEFNDTPALNVFESDGDLPYVAPLIEARWEPNGPVLGGRLRLRGSAVSLSRDDYIGSPVLRPELILTGSTVGYPGVDSRRVSGQAEWRRVMIAPIGIRWEPFVDVRADVYSVSDLPPMLGIEGDTITRSRATAGLDVSYPLIRRLGPDADLILEPMAQLSVSTDPDLDSRIPNEDSETLELDESSLFRIDRFPGSDLLEGGLRFTTGARATLRWGDSRQASLFVGRSFRDGEQNAFLIPVPDSPTSLYDPTGLAADTSDWVVQASFSPSDRIRGWGHATVDSSGDIRRAEVAMDGRWGLRNMGTLSYVVDRSNPLAGPLNRNFEFVQVQAQQFIYGNWGVAAQGIADLERDLITRSEVGLLFDDDCFRFEIGWRRDNTRVRPTGPSEGIYIRLNLATFGGTGYGQGDGR
jgi:LPS-assembly protein